MSEVADADREIAELVQANLAVADRTLGHARRGQHPKHHGCVTATLAVGDWIPEDLRIGIFSKPGRFPAFIRFSNGRVWDDRTPDVHGMAIKLLDVPGPKLVPGHENEMVADFVLVDSEIFFTGDLGEYRAFSEGFLKARPSNLYALYFWIKLIVLHRSLFGRVRRFAAKTPMSPLSIRYFSAVPYRLGPRAVKYVVRPRDPRLTTGPLDDPNGLAKVLAQTLSVADASFDFGVDIQMDPHDQPIEDPTVSWSDQPTARREWLGVLTMPAQKVDLNSALAEDLAFSPWHTNEEHRPLGAINRARGPVYQKMAELRHELNGVCPVGGSEVPTGRERRET